MYDLKQSLLACGYSGPCENFNLLKWAIRAGASSEYFNDLVCWLESQLNLVTSTEQVRENIKRLFNMLRLSILMKPSYGSEAAINPKEFRLQTLKVLVKQLQLRKLPQRMQCKEAIGVAQNKEFKHLKVTLNMNKNQRMVQL